MKVLRLLFVLTLLMVVVTLYHHPLTRDGLVTLDDRTVWSTLPLTDDLKINRHNLWLNNTALVSWTRPWYCLPDQLKVEVSNSDGLMDICITHRGLRSRVCYDNLNRKVLKMEDSETLVVTSSRPSTLQLKVYPVSRCFNRTTAADLLLAFLALEAFYIFYLICKSDD